MRASAIESRASIFLRGIIFLLMFLFVAIVFAMLFQTFKAALNFNLKTPEVFISAILVTYVFLYFMDQKRFEDIGVVKKIPIRDVVLSFVVGSSLMIFLFLLALMFSSISIHPGMITSLEFIFLTTVIFVNAFGEELIFRGYLLNLYEPYLGRKTSILVTSLAFSLLHISNSGYNAIAFLTLTGAGILLCIAFLATRNIWVPTAFHFGWNFFQYIIFGFGSNPQQKSIMISETTNEILSGNSFGPESGILATILMYVALILLIYFEGGWEKKLENV